MKNYYVYIMASRKEGTIYIGVTSNLPGRAWQHKNKIVDGFSKEYNTTVLVYFEQTDSIETAILREKQIKHWKREWKLKLINDNNPEWKDLSKGF